MRRRTGWATEYSSEQRTGCATHTLMQNCPHVVQQQQAHSDGHVQTFATVEWTLALELAPHEPLQRLAQEAVEH